MTTTMHILVHEEAVDGYLEQYGLEHGNVPIVAALLQLEGTAGGQPALMLVIEVEGHKVVAKTTLRLMEAALRAMRAAAEGQGNGSGPEPAS